MAVTNVFAIFYVVREFSIVCIVHACFADS